jgi:hypothetical protein
LRVAALALGVLAGLVASLILALGGLDVAAAVGANADRQAQAIRFGLFLIGNLGIFGAALALASPLAGAIFLILGAVAWVAAAVVIRQSVDFVLITPPALLLLATVFAIIAHIRRPRPEAEPEEDPDVEILGPERAERAAPQRPSEMMDDEEEEVGVPAFAADSRGAAAAPSREDEWNPRKRQPPPPRAKPAFRPIEEEYDEEPSGFSRFAMGVSGFLSFGLYAALAGAAVLIFWSARNAGDQPAAVVAEAPAVSVSAEPSSSEEPRLASSDETLTPILGGEPIRDVMSTPTAPSASTSELVAEAAPSSEPTFITMPTDQVTIPTLSEDFVSEDEPPSIEGASSEVSSSELPPLPSEPSSEEPQPVELEPQPTAASTVAPTVVPDGMAWPRSVPLPIAAQRTAPGTGPTTVTVTQPTNTNTSNTGL